MKALMIKDLETSKELNGQELAAVRGGNVAGVGSQGVFGGPGITLGLFLPVVTQIEVKPKTEINLNLPIDITTVAGSVGTSIVKL